MSLKEILIKAAIRKMIGETFDGISPEALLMAGELEKQFVKIAQKFNIDPIDAVVGASVLLGARVGGMSKNKESNKKIIETLTKFMQHSADRTKEDGAFMVGGGPTPGCRCRACEIKRAAMKAHGHKVEELPDLPFKIGDIVDVVDPLDPEKILERNVKIESILDSKFLLASGYTVGVDSLRPASSQ